MKSLTINNQAVTKQALLEMAQKDPSTWLGVRITAGLLVLEGWTSTQIADLFGLSRWSVVQWIQRLNKEGVIGLIEKERHGRPLKLDTSVLIQLEKALKKNPQDMGLTHIRWDGATVAEYLEREHGIQLKICQAQRLIHRMGFSSKGSIYSFIKKTQDSNKDLKDSVRKS